MLSSRCISNKNIGRGGGELPSLVLFSSCGAEQSGGDAGPPVSPEVIVILLILRKLRLTDAPSEHVPARELCYGGKLSTSILSITKDSSIKEVCYVAGYHHQYLSAEGYVRPVLLMYIQIILRSRCNNYAFRERQVIRTVKSQRMSVKSGLQLLLKRSHELLSFESYISQIYMWVAINLRSFTLGIIIMIFFGIIS